MPLGAGVVAASSPRSRRGSRRLGLGFTDDEGVEDFIARIEPAVVVIGLLVAAYLLGRISVDWPERDGQR